MSLELTSSERVQVATILSRRANEISGYKSEHSCEKFPTPTDKLLMPASVEYALELEIQRLRRLADKISPPKENVEEISE